MADWRASLEALRNTGSCRLTTRGRKTGRRHSVTVWFAAGEGRVYLGTLKLDRDWPKNLRKNPDVEIGIGGLRLRGTARMVTEAERREEIERRLREKYWISRIAGWFGFRPQGVFEVDIEGEAS